MRKFNKKIVLILLVILNLVGFIYFYHVSITKSMVFTYYNTFARLFSILLGMLIGFIHAYYKPLIFKVFKELNLLNFEMNYEDNTVTICLLQKPDKKLNLDESLILNNLKALKQEYVKSY